MCADKVKNIVTLSSDISTPLIADMQYFELYSTEALNRKMKNIVLPGVYCGFEPVPGDGLFVRITSEKTEGRGAASIDVGKCQISVQQVSDVLVPVEAGVTTIIVLEANYEHGVKTSQVDSSSDISAARIIALVDEEIASNQIELCRVIVPDNAQAVTADMISTEYRANRAVGVEFSSALDSDEEYKAATPLAISTLNKLKAPVDSPEFIGIPKSPTPEQGTNSTQIANTAFVQAAITALIDGSPSALDTLKKIADAINNDPQFSQTINAALALKAPLLSPAFTGVPTAPTASQGTNNTQIATTAYVRAAISALVGSSPEALDTLNELAAALGNDPNFATTMTNALAGKQPLDATLTALAGLATGANKLPYFTGTDTVAQTDLTSVGRDILAKTSTLAVIQYLGLEETIKLASEALSTYGGVVNGDVIIKGILSLIGNELLIEKDNGFSGIHIRNKSTVAGSANGVDFSFGGAIMSSLICGIMENGANYIDVALSPAGNISDRRQVAFTLDGNIRQLIPQNGWSIQGYTKNSDFTQAMADAGWVRFPNGIIFQWCWGNTDASGWASAPFPVGWPVRCFGLLACNVAGDSIASAIAGVKRLNDRDMQVTLMERSGVAVSKPFFCIGVGC